jgi:2-oxoglutarate dehydrogenase E2 component (dihydrolipoamide succinyltransferase)
MTEIRVPTLGESVSEATIGKWFKKPGDAVRKDEPLLELETDKVTLEVNAPEAGVLAEITAADGSTVGVGALLGQISAGAAGATAGDTGKATAAATPAKAEAPAKPGTPEAVPAAGDAPIQAKSGKTDMPPAPAAAKMMAETGVAVDAGSGKRGQVLKEDVMAAVARAALGAG